MVAAVDSGTVTLDAGTLLLGRTDRTIRLTGRFTARASPTRGRRNLWSTRSAHWCCNGWLASHWATRTSKTTKHDPVLAVLAGKLAAKHTDCAPLAGKSTLNWLELSHAEATIKR